MTLIDFTCPKCGAALKIENGASQVSCEYCGSSFIVDGASAAAPAPTPSPSAAPQPTGKKTPCGGYSAGYSFSPFRLRYSSSEARRSSPS